jgi:hypothetical protein
MRAKCQSYQSVMGGKFLQTGGMLVAQVPCGSKDLITDLRGVFMKKYVLITAVLSLVATQVIAQNTSVDAEVDAELDQMYGSQAPGGAQPIQVQQGQPQGNQGQPIYIMNQPVQSQPVQKQPTTYIEASPLNKSRADQMRENRQQVEAETETKIVEKLEQSRIEDEKKRANVLFGDKLDNMNQPQQPVQQAAPVSVVMPAAPAEPQEDTREVIREELQMALAAEAEKTPMVPETQKYFSAIAGVGDYPDVANVQGNYLLGVSFGNKYNNVYAVEGSFIASNYSVAQMYYGYGSMQYCPPFSACYNIPTVEVQQYSAAIAVKYFLMDSMVRPVVGGLAQFSYRTFTPDSGYYYSDSSVATSHAIDLGVITGADIEFSPTFALGLDFKYMFNLSSRVTVNGQHQWFTNPSAIEKLQYYTLSLAARVNF